jgi:hypothetical protein
MSLRLRFDYSSYFWLLPLDVHRLIAPYTGAFGHNFECVDIMYMAASVFCVGNHIITNGNGMMMVYKKNRRVSAAPVRVFRNIHPMQLYADFDGHVLVQDGDGKLILFNSQYDIVSTIENSWRIIGHCPRKHLIAIHLEHGLCCWYDYISNSRGNLFTLQFDVKQIGLQSNGQIVQRLRNCVYIGSTRDDIFGNTSDMVIDCVDQVLVVSENVLLLYSANGQYCASYCTSSVSHWSPICADDSCNIYVSDTLCNRICKLKSF